MAVENRGPQLAAVCWTLVTTAVIATLLRCYVRLRIVKNFGFDDWCMLAALASFILFVTCALVGIHYGTGRHYWDLTDHQFSEAMKFWWYCYLWYCLAMIASKISIGYFLLRITVRRVDVWIIYSVMVITVLTGCVFFFVTLLQCHPISYFWNRTQKGSCISVEIIIALTYLYSAFSVICDFTFATLPLVLIWKLNMDRRSKIALVPIMAMACVASAAVVIRFAFVKDFKSTDFLYATVDIAIWSTTEQGLAITAGSLATLRPLIRVVGQRLGLSSQGPSQLQDTEPPSSGFARRAQNSGGSKKYRGPFSLTTFGRDDPSETDCEAGQSKDGLQPVDITGKRGSIWSAREKGDKNNESEEELTSKNSRGSCWEQTRILKVTSITVAEDRV